MMLVDRQTLSPRPGPPTAAAEVDSAAGTTVMESYGNPTCAYRRWSIGRSIGTRNEWVPFEPLLPRFCPPDGTFCTHCW